MAVAVLATCPALGAQKKAPAKTYTARQLPQDPFLPSYVNPQEADLKKGKLHVSLKGVFRGVDPLGNPDNWVYFAFTAEPQEDMYLAVGQSELFDSRSREYKYRSVPDIGGERLFGRNVVAGIRVPVLVGVNMPLAEAGEFPSVSRVTITFNGEALQFRNIVAEDWSVWESLRETL